MINKKNLLDKTPHDLGIKDAVHVAIVSVRAAQPLNPGQRCGLNKDREAIPQHNGPGVVSPWINRVTTGDVFWMMLNMTEVPNVQHTWEHPTIDFSPPTKPVKRNSTLNTYAKKLKVEYSELIDAMSKFVDKEIPIPYPGKINSADELAEVMENIDKWDIWSEWAEETGYEFYNMGTQCCPEYEYPSTEFFVYDEAN